MLREAVFSWTQCTAFSVLVVKVVPATVDLRAGLKPSSQPSVCWAMALAGLDRASRVPTLLLNVGPTRVTSIDQW